MAKGAKVVTISYGLFNNPNNGRIEQAIGKWMSKGYILQDRKERPVGCAMSLFTMGWARGRTELTFVLRDMVNPPMPQYPQGMYPPQQRPPFPPPPQGKR